MLKFLVNHVLKFKFLVKRMPHAKVDCSHFNPSAKRLINTMGCPLKKIPLQPVGRPSALSHYN